MAIKTKSPPKQQVRHFAKEYKRGLELTNNNIKVCVSRGSISLDQEGLRKWFIYELHRKINHKGGVRQEYRETYCDLRRDGELYTNWTQGRRTNQWGLRFHTRYFKKRFSEMELEFKECFDFHSPYDL